MRKAMMTMMMMTCMMKNKDAVESDRLILRPRTPSIFMLS